MTFCTLDFDHPLVDAGRPSEVDCEECRVGPWRLIVRFDYLQDTSCNFGNISLRRLRADYELVHLISIEESSHFHARFHLLQRLSVRTCDVEGNPIIPYCVLPDLLIAQQMACIGAQ